jgi:hypothetical protein
MSTTNANSVKNENWKAALTEFLEALTELAKLGTKAMSEPLITRFTDFDDTDHPFRKWWETHGQFMLSGGGRRESIWAARGWIAREQLAQGVEVTGESRISTSEALS